MTENNLKHLIEVLHLHIIFIILYKDIMPYVDKKNFFEILAKTLPEWGGGV